MRIKLIVLSLFVIFGASLFYWYQIRPAQIKHDCSWVKMYSNAVPARPAMTKEQLISKGIIRSCNAEIAKVEKLFPYSKYELGTNKIYSTSLPPINGVIRPMSEDPLWEATSCIEDGDRVITEYKNAIKAIPSKDWYEKATKDEYTFCLHDKGL